MRVLVADDHEKVRRSVSEILTSHGADDIVNAVDGNEAVTKAHALRPDVIIMDVSMPVMDGIAAARNIRKFLPTTPILFFSSHDAVHIIREARLLGVQGFLAKSEAGKSLWHAIEFILRNETFFPNE